MLMISMRIPDHTDRIIHQMKLAENITRITIQPPDKKNSYFHRPQVMEDSAGRFFFSQTSLLMAGESHQQLSAQRASLRIWVPRQLNHLENFPVRESPDLVASVVTRSECKPIRLSTKENPDERYTKRPAHVLMRVFGAYCQLLLSRLGSQLSLICYFAINALDKLFIVQRIVCGLINFFWPPYLRVSIGFFVRVKCTFLVE